MTDSILARIAEIEHTQPPFEAFITNLGKYSEGELVGKWLAFPTTKEEVQAALKEIGIDGVRYEEYFFTDYECNVEGIYDVLPEYANIEELNYLAERIEEIDEYDMPKFEAALAYGSYTNSVADIINLTDNLDCFDFQPDVEDEYDLGYYWIEEAGAFDLSSLGNLSSYIDYEAFGRDIAMDESGMFTDGGYIRDTGDSFTEYYRGLEDIPDEYRIFALPDIENEQEKKAVSVLVTIDALKERQAERKELAHEQHSKIPAQAPPQQGR